MKLITILAVFTLYIMPLFSQAPEKSSSIIVQLNNIKNDKGLIGINVFSSDEGFPSDYKKSYVSKTFEIDSHNSEYVIENVPPGTYGVSVLHDENSNSKLDTNIFGAPKEGYAVSNNAKARRFGPPKYGDAMFNHGSEDSILKLNLKY